MGRKASAKWHGTGKEGSGSLTSISGVLNETPYSFTTRFLNEDGKAGTNPEELIAAAHAGCFTMALSFQISGAGFTPTELNTEADVNMRKEGEGFIISTIHLTVTGEVPNISEQQFLELAKVAKENCPVSKALSAVEISMSATLKS